MRRVSTIVRGLFGSNGGKRLLRAAAISSLGAALATQAVTGVAEAQPKPARSKRDAQSAARARGEEGLHLFEAERWAEAYDAFRDADELYHANTLVLFMARCQRNMGKLMEARGLYLKVAGEEVPKGALDQFRKAQAAARDELEIVKTRIPSVKVAVTGFAKDKATATLDGASADLAELGGGREVNPGEHTIAVDAPGAVRVEKRFVAAEGDVAQVSIDLAPTKQQEEKAPFRMPRSIVPGGALLSVGVLGLGTGAVTGIIAMSKIDDIKSRCSPSGHCLTTDKPNADSAQTFVTVSTIGFAVGGVGLAAGAVFLALRPGGGKAEAQAKGPHVTIGLGSIGVEGAF